jgi:hypothetical protein
MQTYAKIANLCFLLLKNRQYLFRRLSDFLIQRFQILNNLLMHLFVCNHYLLEHSHFM